jgi:LacI family transcriptional regulator
VSGGSGRQRGRIITERVVQLAGASKPSKRSKGVATIRHVAEHAGVSPMTVSRVINGEGPMKEATRDLVMASIRSLDYAPNWAARSLAGVSLVRVGLLCRNTSAAYVSEMIIGCLEQCRHDHVHLTIERSDVEGDEARAAERITLSNVDGVILAPPFSDNLMVLKVLADHRKPVVAVAGGQDHESASTIRIDDFEAARSMTWHLLEMGHRAIGFIKGHPHRTTSNQRLLGYLAALQEAGVEPAPGLVAQGFFSYQSGLVAAAQLLDRSSRPTAIFASNDDMAAAAVAVAHWRGLAVPADLTITGFDDSPLATTISPELTTIRQPTAEMSRQAIAILVEEVRNVRLGHAPNLRRATLPFTLIRRQSEAPPRPIPERTAP